MSVARQYARSLQRNCSPRPATSGVTPRQKSRGGLAHNSLDLRCGQRGGAAAVGRCFDRCGPGGGHQRLPGENCRRLICQNSDGDLKAALDALAADRPESEIEGILKKVSDATISNALEQTKDAANEFDAASGPINTLPDKMDEKLMSGSPDAFRSFCRRAVAHTPGHAMTWRPNLNQAVASMYEMQVREAKYRGRRNIMRGAVAFSSVCCAAQSGGEIIATFSIAVRGSGNFLWSLAAAAGAGAVAFSLYVCIYV